MIFLDMDGVLADFMTHTKNLRIPNNHQWFEPKSTWTEETWEGERIKTAAMHSHGFWLKMPMTPDAQKLWDAVPEHERAVLTAKPQPDSPILVAWEKYAWINKNLGFLPLDRFICCTREEKVLYAPKNILVDDDSRTCKMWDEHGGVAIHYNWAKNSTGDGKTFTTIEWPDINYILANLRGAMNA